MPTVDDIVIVGGGPVGLFGLYHTHLRQLQAKLIESLPELGGQVMALYPEKYIYDVAGFPKVLGRELIDLLREQSVKGDAEICLDEKVVELERRGEIWRLGTNRGEHFARTVLLAAGLGAFNPRKIGAVGEDEFVGRGVHYFVRELKPLYGKRILVVGGGDSAVDWATTFHPHADVRLIHRLKRWQAHEASVQQMRDAGIRIGQPWELREIRGDAHVREAVIGEVGQEQSETIAVDEIIICAGFSTDLGPIRNWGLSIRGGRLEIDWGMTTTLPGVFAAGDLVNYQGKAKLIALGFGEIGIAVDSAVHYLYPDQRITTKHSSDRGFQQEVRSPAGDRDNGPAIVSMPYLPGHRIVEVFGVVSGLVVRSRGIGPNLVAGLRPPGGGGIWEYTSMLDTARRHALQG